MGRKLEMGEEMLGAALKSILERGIGGNDAEVPRLDVESGSVNGDSRVILVKVKTPEPLKAIPLNRDAAMHATADQAQPGLMGKRYRKSQHGRVARDHGEYLPQTVSLGHFGESGSMIASFT
jgi:hypothetical protein